MDVPVVFTTIFIEILQGIVVPGVIVCNSEILTHMPHIFLKHWLYEFDVFCFCDHLLSHNVRFSRTVRDVKLQYKWSVVLLIQFRKTRLFSRRVSYQIFVLFIVEGVFAISHCMNSIEPEVTKIIALLAPAG